MAAQSGVYSVSPSEEHLDILGSLVLSLPPFINVHLPLGGTQQWFSAVSQPDLCLSREQSVVCRLRLILNAELEDQTAEFGML